MKRTTALILFTVADLFGFALVYFFAYQPLKQVFADIANRAEFIEYNTTFFIAFGSVLLPTVHAIGLIETYLPRYFNRKICTNIMYASLILPLMIGIGTGNWVKKEILRSGYAHCSGADTHMKLAHFKVYVLDDDTCLQLTLEREQRRYGRHISRK